MTSPSKFAPTPIRWVYSPDANTEPMLSRALGLSGLLKLSSCVAGAGATLPPEFVTVRDRITSFCAEAAGGAHVLFDRLAEALLTGQGDPWPHFVAVCGQAGAGAVEQRAEVLSRVHTAAEGRLRDLYRPVAATNYRQLAARFDKTADAFHHAASIVDPTTDASAVVNSDKRTLQAWRDAAVLAGQLDAQIEGLSACAELLRALNMPSGTGISRDTFLIALVADTTDLHPRLVWHAWRDWAEPQPPRTGLSIEGFTAADTEVVQNTRCGRWGRLVAIGATLRACESPEQMPLFGQPAPIGIKPTLLPGMRQPVGVRFDPCGELPTEAPKRRPLDRLRAAFRRSTDEPEAESYDLGASFLGADTTEGE